MNTKEMFFPMSGPKISNSFSIEKSGLKNEWIKSGMTLTPAVALKIADLVNCANQDNSPEPIQKSAKECIDMIGINEGLAREFYNLIYGPEVEKDFTSNNRQKMEDYFCQKGLYFI